MRTKKNTYVFKLTDIDIQKVHETYIQIPDNIKLEIENNDNTTKLSELNSNCNELVSFLDESKRDHTCNVSMIDFISKKNINLLRYHCFWCKFPFKSKPIGCPINYVPSQAIKKYFSHISREVYTIKEKITEKLRKKIENKEGNKIKIINNEYYETDGVFCSFNCCKAYIEHNKHDRKYDKSSLLLVKMYNQIMNTENVSIASAPHWRTLEQFGGHLNIVKFRSGFGKVEYEKHGNTQGLKFLPTGVLFEEKIKF